MKKRVKLLTTVASLCLAVALMAFGVYAATSSTFAVVSTVTFESHVSVTWGITTSGGAEANDAEHLDGVTFEATPSTTDADFEDATVQCPDLEFGTQDGEDEITYVITALNTQTESAIVVSLAEAATLFSHDNLAVTVTYEVTDDENSTVHATANTLANAADPAALATVAAGDTLTITITVTLEDASIAVQNGNTLNAKFKAVSAA